MDGTGWRDGGEDLKGWGGSTVVQEALGSLRGSDSHETGLGTVGGLCALCS